MAMGRLLVATDVRLRRTADGSVLSTHPVALFATFEPFTDVYKTVTLLARKARDDQPTVGEADGPGVDFAAVPDFTSLRALALGLPALMFIAWREVGRHDVIFGRLPEPLSLLVGCMAMLRGKPFIANVVADPSHPRLGAGWQGRSVNRLVLLASRLLVKKAAATIFVTRSYLQRLCPPGPGPTMVRSNVRIGEDWFRAPRSGLLGDRPRVVLVGSNQSWDKGQLVLLDAASHLAREGLTIDVTFVGGGQNVDNLKDEARKRGLPGAVDVLGQVESRERLGEVLDEHDVFCLPSLSEGLPRAMVEAMARGLPAVGSSVGGIPELLPPEAVCEPGNAIDLAVALRLLVIGPQFNARSSDAVHTARGVADAAKRSALVEFLRSFETSRRADDQAAGPALGAPN
jgi:phosphatidylinositol alpha-1,6-mannosyltransferase